MAEFTLTEAGGTTGVLPPITRTYSLGEVVIDLTTPTATTYGETFLQTTVNENLATEIQTLGDIKLFDILIPADTIGEAQEIIIDYAFYCYGSTGALRDYVQLTNDGNTSTAVANPYTAGDLYCATLRANCYLSKMKFRIVRLLDKLQIDEDTSFYWTARPETHGYGLQDLGLTLDFTKDITISILMRTAQADSKVMVLNGIRAKIIG